MNSASSSAILAGQLETLYNSGTVASLTDDQLLERFLRRGDKLASEAAFAALVERHGTMVLAVCRRIVSDQHDADDAFQATFLVLARRARSIQGQGTVAGWLFGIARRVAVRARVETTRQRRQLEKLHAERLVRNNNAEPTRSTEFEPDYSPLIIAIDRLPQRLRVPIILHYFEGVDTESIAQRLGCPRGTVLSRLARARERLRHRLEHRAFTLDTLLPIAAASRMGSGVTVPSTLVQSTVKAASCLSLAGTAIDSVVPATVANLSRGVVRSLVFARVRLASVPVILGLASLAIGLTMAAPSIEQTAGPQLATTAYLNEPTKGDSIVRGKVVDPDGKPFAGARIVLCLPELEPVMSANPQYLTVSGDDGRFEASMLRSVLDQPDAERASFATRPVVAALARGFGPDWIKVDSSTAGNDIVLRLRRDDVPIEGHIVGLEGQRLAGMTVKVSHIAEFTADLLKKLRENGSESYPTLWNEMRNGMLLEKGGLNPVVRTNTDGRFRLTGVGRDRVATVLIEGDSIRQTIAMVSTSSDPGYTPLDLPADIRGKLLGPRFNLTVAPGRVIEGVIRDRDTGRPIAGAQVRSRWGNARATSDAQGRYRIAGQPKRADIVLDITVQGEPYVKAEKSIGNPAGMGPIPVDVTLKRGVWVEGKVTDRVIGRPLHAVVQYYPLRDNPHLRDSPEKSFLARHPGNEAKFPTDADGRFRAVALPGAGMLAVRTSERGFLNAPPLTPRAAGNVLAPGNFMFQMMEFQALVPISPGDVDKAGIPDINLVPGRTQHIQAVNPDGSPVAGIRVSGHQRDSRAGEIKGGFVLPFVHPQPGRLETIVILDKDQSMGASIDVKGDEADPIRVVLRPVGTVTGRLVDEDGRPRRNVLLRVDYRFQSPWDPSGGDPRYVFHAERFSGPVLTGPDGRFSINGLVAGISTSVSPVSRSTSNGSFLDEGHLHAFEWTINPGETQDWGDVVATKP